MAVISLQMWAPLLFASVAGYLAWQVLYNIFFSPLSAVPGPRLAKITPKWLILVDLAGNRTSTIHKLHQQYGATVRIGPKEVSFANAEAIKEIYSQQSTYPKAPIYDHLSVKPLGIFSMRDRKEHSQRRRLLSHAFSQSNLIDTEPLIGKIIGNLVGRIDDTIGESLDVLLCFRLTAFDIVGELFLGQSFNGLTSSTKPQFLEDMDHHFLLSGIESSLPAMYALLAIVPVPAVRHFLQARHRIIEYGKSSYNKYIAQHDRNSGRKDLLTKIITVNNEEKAPLTDQETYTEIANLVFAGTDTTSTTLTYLFWELAKHPHWQAKLRTELAAEKSATGVPRLKDIADLPILNALVTEALRLHPAAPASLQRETPSGGSMLNGFHIPEKTVVSVQCYTTQRDFRVYSSPDAFLPERWIDAEGVSESMKTYFLPFSRGTRSCLGQSLAMMELKLITATLIMRYSVCLAPDTTEASMVMNDHFLTLPKSGKCDLIFTRV